MPRKSRFNYPLRAHFSLVNCFQFQRLLLFSIDAAFVYFEYKTVSNGNEFHSGNEQEKKRFQRQLILQQKIFYDVNELWKVLIRSDFQ